MQLRSRALWPLACLCAVALSSCEPEGEPLEGGHGAHAGPHGGTPHVLTTNPVRQDVTVTRDYVAQIRAIQHIEVRALERGYLQDIFVDEGRTVAEGSTMFQIMPLLHQAELERAEAEAQYAKIEYENTKLLADDGVVSPTELALADAKVHKADAEAQLARLHRGLTEIKAPFEGIMGRFHVRLGSLVDEGELLTTLSDNRKVWVYFNVSEAEYLQYQASREGAAPLEVELVMANGELFPRPGLVETIEADFNNETGNIAFRATFENPDGLLRHGQTGKVRVSTVLEDVVVVPQKATFEVLDKRYVYTVDETSTVHSRPIVVAEELPHLFVLDGGLAPEETIVLEGIRKVRDGHVAEVRFQDPAEALAGLEVHAE